MNTATVAAPCLPGAMAHDPHLAVASKLYDNLMGRYIFIWLWSVVGAP
jgi:hypothetical protein